MDGITIDLIEKSREGDRFALNEIIKRSRDYIRNYIRVKLYNSNINEAEDLCQDVCIYIYRGIAALRDPKAYKNWVTMLSLNKVYDFLRKKTKRVKMDTGMLPDHNKEDIFENMLVYNQSAEDTLYGQWIHTKIHESFDRVPVQFLKAFLDVEVKGLKYIEASNSMPLGTLKSRVYRAKLALRKELDHIKNEYYLC